MRHLKNWSFSLFVVCFLLPVLSFAESPSKKKPRLSIITSVWNGDQFIEGFLEDTTNQTIFPECELIMINPGSPGNEEVVIQKYMKKYPNILYFKLPKDPGLYGVWNYGIKMASSDFITNANLDDRSRKDGFELLVKELEADPALDLVYSGYYITNSPNETFDKNTHTWAIDSNGFSLQNLMKGNEISPRPVWRKSMNAKYGLFDEHFVIAGDFEMWTRAISLGAKFKKFPTVTILYYLNPKGLSTDQTRIAKSLDEQRVIHTKYGYLLQQNGPK